MAKLAEGVGELKLAFEPGLQIGDETVCRTFQPSFVVTRSGAILVFCQGRTRHGNDDAPKVILMNRSVDGGQTWEDAQPLTQPMNHFAISAWTSDRAGRERISFLVCVTLHETKLFYDGDLARMKKSTGIDVDEVGADTASVICKFDSDDDGKTWQRTVLTGSDTPLYQTVGGWTPVFFNTIGQVSRIDSGEHAGRLIIAGPVYGSREGTTPSSDFRQTPVSGSGVFYSDDDGDSWHAGGMVHDYLCNEASAASVDGGSELLMIRRSNNARHFERAKPLVDIRPGEHQRVAHRSSDGGATWSDACLVDMSDLHCHGTLARKGGRLYFSIPEGPLELNEPPNWSNVRERGAIYFSDDGGKSWNHRIAEPGLFSYSTVGQLDDERMITFFARGGLGDQGIGYRIFTDAWLDEASS